MYKNDGYVRRYSESFKLKVLDELSKGIHSKRQVGLLYGIQPSTINKWTKNYTGCNSAKIIGDGLLQFISSQFTTL